MYSEDDLLPISGLQHLAYCPRQFALIHLERAWAENLYTAEGAVLHKRTDSAEAETRGAVHTARSLRLHSLALGLSGIADVVEFHRVSDPGSGIALPKLEGRWRPFPVEYKRGRPKSADWDRIQLCAQAMCLEEMLGLPISSGALFYGKTRRRKEVVFNPPLRQQTADLAAEMHRLFDTGLTPPPEPSPKCDHCSLSEICMPDYAGRDTADYLDRMLQEVEQEQDIR